MAGATEGKEGEMVGNNGAGKRLYYCYYWDNRVQRYVLYGPVTINAGVKRLCDLSLHLISVEKLRSASSALLISTDRQPPEFLTNVDEIPSKKTWRKRVFKLHRVVEF